MSRSFDHFTLLALRVRPAQQDWQWLQLLMEEMVGAKLEHLDMRVLPPFPALGM